MTIVTVRTGNWLAPIGEVIENTPIEHALRRAHYRDTAYFEDRLENPLFMPEMVRWRTLHDVNFLRAHALDDLDMWG